MFQILHRPPSNEAAGAPDQPVKPVRWNGRPSRGRARAEQPLSLKERLLALLHSDPLINGVVAVAVTVGFLHGWLKIRFPHPATTFAYDALLIVALVLAYLQQKRRETFIPPGRIGNALKAFYVLCFAFLLLPETPPLILGLAAIRGWCFATLMFCLGYRLTKSILQVRSYFYVLILLGLGTAAYGLQQTPEEVEEQMMEDANFRERYQYTYYHTSQGRQLRIFSTFVSSGAFGGTMAYVSIFIIVLLSDPKTPRAERLALAAVLFPIAYAMVRSGARSALMSLIFGFVVIAWYRRNFFNWILVPAAIVGVLKLAAVTTGGSAAERFATLLNFDEIYYRNYIPTIIGWEYMKEGHWLGGGLGRSGYSVPNFLPGMIGFRDFRSSDGDLGRLMIEMGMLGLIFFGRLLWVAVSETIRVLRRLQDTPESTVALASAACIVMALASFPSGSPFLGVPMGTLVWFFLGTLMKLHDRQAAAAAPEPADADVTGDATAPAKRFLHRRVPGAKPGKRSRAR